MSPARAPERALDATDLGSNPASRHEEPGGSSPQTVETVKICPKMVRLAILIIVLAPGHGFFSRRSQGDAGRRVSLPARIASSAFASSRPAVKTEQRQRSTTIMSMRDGPRGTPVSDRRLLGKRNYGPVVKAISAEGQSDRWKDKPIFKKPGELLLRSSDAPEAACVTCRGRDGARRRRLLALIDDYCRSTLAVRRYVPRAGERTCPPRPNFTRKLPLSAPKPRARGPDATAAVAGDSAGSGHSPARRLTARVAGLIRPRSGEWQEIRRTRRASGSSRA